MQHVYLALALGMVALVPAPAQSRIDQLFPGYIVTRDGHAFTGQIGGLGWHRGTMALTYVNDFGSVYRLPAGLIQGFAYRDLDRQEGYTCRLIRREWAFLHVVEHGPGAVLYQVPVFTLSFTLNGEAQFLLEEPANQVFLETANGALKRLHPLFYRRALRMALQARYPELAAKIGQPGYRFKQLKSIISAFNQHCRLQDGLQVL